MKGKIFKTVRGYVIEYIHPDGRKEEWELYPTQCTLLGNNPPPDGTELEFRLTNWYYNVDNITESKIVAKLVSYEF